MGLDELKEQNLLLPEKMWGGRPAESWRSRAQIVVCGLLFLVSALCIWFGGGSWVTFLGIGIFLVDLFLFLIFTFRAVDYQVGHLVEMGVGGKVEGFAREGDEGRDAGAGGEESAPGTADEGRG
ncbi:MAG: hypothetical protein GWM92_06715 [Gemmatimonadetes bacterium]|nr:hypothetical protein [Gemmatimonadota bacterium]NIR78307.1 hypothetical protein [Gemmatimonadota bacterium]NIT86895.1 hypothetical protein [Gemmatimonadota bacterium]NIU30755.1 hypothetical protein [Gemmatimonadota bacterium]NIU35548.1 hypothetical protein [Gemmatimonadota bacterium]